MNLKVIYSNILIAICLLSFSSCEKDMEGKIFQVFDDKMLDELMEERSELSSFLQIIDMSDMRGTVHVHGIYTLFAPTNTAIDEYLRATGRSSITELTKEEALGMVRYHFVPDTLSTLDFIDGRLASPNFLNRYLTTKTLAEESGVIIRVNRQANIVEKDVRGANGYLHVVDNVLTIPTQSITNVIESLPPEYRLMKEFYEQSGFAETLDSEVTKSRWFTFFIQDDEAFASAGITDYESLIERLKLKTPNIPEDSLLYNYMAYHCLPSLNYVADLLMSSFSITVAGENMMIKRNGDQVLLDEYEINGQVEPGVPVDRQSDYTDLSCSNGVVHKINGNIEIVKRSAYRIYWDIAEQPEIMSLRDFRKAGTTVSFEPGDLADVDWAGKLKYLNYVAGNPAPTAVDRSGQYVYGDYLHFRLSTHVTEFMQFKTPLLPEGRYKVWICYRPIGRDEPHLIRTIFKQDGKDDQLLGVPVFSRYGPNDDSYGMPTSEEAFHIRAEQDGFKQYNAYSYSNVMISKMVGIIDVESTGRHYLRFEATTQSNSEANYDMIQFIPIEDEQRWPRIDIRGKWIYQHMDKCEIWPNVCVEEPENPEEGAGE